MNCPELLCTQAYLDGELDGHAAAEAERHVETCADCQAFSTDAALLSDAIRRNLVRHAAPTGLRARIGAALDAERPSARVLPFRLGGRSFWTGAAGGAAVSALAAAFAILAILPPTAGTLAQSVADAHTQALMTGNVIQVVSSSHHTVKPWFAGRVPLSPPVADFAQQGFALAGGRTDEIAGNRAAVVVYRHGRHEIDLFVWADSGAHLPNETVTRGYRMLFWTRGDLDFAAVSDMEEAEMRKFVQLVRSEPE
ncbi:MAG TPA: zf-HC2 domain-containing protein [Rhizomicrobium sp.]|jgi:anti-sigma factor RsiW